MQASISKMVFDHAAATALCLLTLASGTALAAPAATTLTTKSLAENLQPLGIVPRIESIRARSLQGLEAPEDRYLLKVTLGRLSAAHFNAIRAMQGGHSKVPYSARRTYELIDFLPPAMQALVNRTFTTSSEEVLTSNEEINYIFKDGIGILSNCYNTTFELLRLMRPGTASPGPRFFWPDRWKTTDFALDPRYSTRIHPNQIARGDVLMFFGRESGSGAIRLQHTALLLSKDLVFEKTDSGDKDPYRISFAADVIKKYERVLRNAFPRGHRYEYRRFGGAKPPVPDVRDGLDYALGPQHLNLVPPTIRNRRINAGCETGLGDGCASVFSEVQVGELTLDPRTGRGVIAPPPSVASRLLPIIP